MNTKEIEDVYPLSPMQQGMMFHSLLSPESGVYVEQVSCLINGMLDLKAFRLALQQLVDDHAVLRTSFRSKGLKEPLQVVLRKVEVPLQIFDWRSFTDDECKTEYENFCLSDQLQGFDLTKAPLLRFTLTLAANDSYYFIWTYHHILLDGWSMPLLFREILLRYDALSNGRQYISGSAETYRDYIVWLKKQNMQEAEKYWRNLLKDLDSPTIISRRNSYNREEEKYSDINDRLPEEMMGQLQAFALKYQLTMNTIVQGAWAILLSAYTRQKDVVYGTTVSGRPVDLQGAGNIIGLLINTLPVRAILTPGQTLYQWLIDFQMRQLEMRQYEYTPLSEIQKYTGVPNTQALFDSLLVFENYPLDALKDAEIKGLRIGQVKTAEKTNFPMVLVVLLSGTLEFRLIYETGSIEASIAANMLENLKNVICSFVKPETRTLSDVEILSEKEKLNILRSTRNFTDAFSNKYCLHKLFELQAAKTPENTAVVFMDQKLTYMQLNKKANRLANYLIRKGVKRDSMVGVMVARSAEMIIAILGILKAGAAYVPLDPYSPSERMEFMIKDAQLEYLITQKVFAHERIQLGLQVTFMDSDWEKIAGESEADPRAECSPDNLAYVIYTSGSTGKPKGVLINHMGASNFVIGFSLPPAMNSSERGLQFFSVTFDGSVADIFPVLISGAALYIPDKETLLDARKTEKFISENSITSMVTTPSVLSVLNESKIPGLKTIISAGEILSCDLALKFSSKRKFFNAYGPTEASVGVSMFDMDDLSNYYSSVPIGKALINTKLLILDGDLKIIPVGCVGELYIGGFGLSRGYLNRPDMTAEKFIPDPYADSPGERIFKTGDLVRLLPEGNFEYIERIDQQVKIRGFRIELGEIEAAINKCRGVNDAVALVKGDEFNDKRIVAYVIPEEEQQFDLLELKKSCANALPDYMIPSKFIVLKEFPLTASGKIDKKALPEPDHAFADHARVYTPPGDALQCKLAEIFEDVLKVHPVGIKDNFFEIGGHSLLAIRLMDLIQEKLNRGIPLVTIYQNPTVESLAPFLKDDGETVKSPLLVELKKSGEMEPLFFMHPSGGSVHWYSDLAKFIDTATPFYGIQAIGINGKDKLDDSIEAMASRYIKYILQKQPEGPYYIGGWSFGVIVAFEVACQLAARGYEVNMLALLDCGPFMPYGEPKDSAELLAGIFSRNLRIDVNFLRQMEEGEQFKYVFKMAKKNEIIPFYVRLSQFSFYINILKTMQQAWRKYNMKKYPGKITLFRSEESKDNPSAAPDMGWAEFSSQPVNVIDVPGTHISMIQQPNASILAEHINSIIRNCRNAVVDETLKDSNTLG